METGKVEQKVEQTAEIAQALAQKAKAARPTLESRVLEVLKANVGKELSVKEIAVAVNVNERSLRRVLRKLRNAMPDKLAFFKAGAKTTYIYGGTPEQIEQAKKKASEAAPKRKRARKKAVAEAPTAEAAKPEGEVELLEEEVPTEEESEEEPESLPEMISKALPK
jgi:malonyl CoA-acyl carrier protein transacylase